MNIQKFTQKSLDAINSLEKITYDHGNQEIAQIHLLYAMLTQEDGIMPKLIEKMEINLEHFTDNVESHIGKRHKVSGGNAYIGNKLNKVLVSAEDEAKAMNDSYVSIEHLLLSMLKYPDTDIKDLMNEYGITRERFLTALATVRGNHNVTTDNPEATYDTLEKYGQDLVERARSQ